MSCTVQGIPVDACPASFVPELSRALVAFTTRTTFYMQCMLVAFNSAMDVLIRTEINRSKHGADKERAQVFFRKRTGVGSLHQLILMTMALSCTALVLGFAPHSTLNFHSALVVVYILFLCGTTITVSAPIYGRLGINLNELVQNCAIFTMWTSIFVFTVAVLVTAKRFGPSYCCNDSARAVLFHTFPALGVGQTIGYAFVALSVAIVLWWIFASIKNERVDPGFTSETRDQARVLFFFGYIIFWVVMVTHTELVIRQNDFAYAFIEGQEVAMSDAALLAQTLQVTQIITFFTPFANGFETYRKIRLIPEVLRNQVWSGVPGEKRVSAMSTSKQMVGEKARQKRAIASGAANLHTRL